MAVKQAELGDSASLNGLLVSVLPPPHAEVPTTVIRSDIPFDGGMLRHTMEFPTNPDDITDPAPGLVIDGLGACADSYTGLRHEMAVLGKPMATVDSHAVPEIGQLPAYVLRRFSHLSHLSELVAYSERSLQEAVSVTVESLQEEYAKIRFLNMEYFDLVCHSLGARIGAVEALKNPERYRTVTAVEFIGGEGPHAFLDMAGRSPRFVAEELAPNVRRRKDAHTENGWLKTAGRAISEIVTDPIRAASEAWLAGTAMTKNEFLRLKAMGIGVAGILGEEDTYIDAGQTVSHCRGVFDPFVIVAGALHVDPVIRPWLFAKPIVDGISKMHAKQASEASA